VSNFRAIATATEALRRYLERSLSSDIPEFAVKVQAVKPPADPPSEPTVSVFLYQATPNGALRNRDAPTRDRDGRVLARPQAAVDLHYVISFYGEEPTLIPQRMLGSVVRALHEQPTLSRADLLDAAAAPFLSGSDLAESPQLVRLTPNQLDIDDMSKLWSMLFQTPFALSVIYTATAVLIDGNATPASAMPVLRRGIAVEPFIRPLIQTVLSRPAGSGARPDDGPVTRDRELALVGRNLRRPGMSALVGGSAADVVSSGDELVVLAQPAELPSGVHPVQLRYDVALGNPAKPHPALESNAAPYVRRPRVLAATQQPAPPDGQAVRMRLDIPVLAEQRVTLLLDERAPAGRPHSYQFTAPFPATPGHEVTVPVDGVEAGTYLVRVQVDGAQSPLDVDGGTFSGPVVEIVG
jgi:Pvc16 N-terminal domain